MATKVGSVSDGGGSSRALEAFNEDNESITQYLERVELYFEANGIQAEKQRC